jgi:hypothetical protein
MPGGQARVKEMIGRIDEVRNKIQKETDTRNTRVPRAK